MILFISFSALVPPDNSNVEHNRDALMWLNAYGARKHSVYLGKSVDALEYQETLNDGDNVFYFKESLEAGSTYHWRVDAEFSPNEIYQGDVWEFKTKMDTSEHQK